MTAILHVKCDVGSGRKNITIAPLIGLFFKVNNFDLLIWI